MRCTTCKLPMETRQVDGYDVDRCRGCGATALQDLALVGILDDDGGTDRLLLGAELEAIGGGDAVAACPACGRESVRLGLLRGSWIGLCGVCRTVTLSTGGLDELRWKVRDQRLAEVEEELDEWAGESPREGLLFDVAAAAVRWWRRVVARRAGRRAGSAASGDEARLPPPPGNGSV